MKIKEALAPEVARRAKDVATAQRAEAAAKLKLDQALESWALAAQKTALACDLLDRAKDKATE